MFWRQHQTNEQAKWIEAQSEYLKRREEREKRALEFKIELWHPHTGELLNTLKGHSDMVFSVAFSADEQLLASGSFDDTIKLWHPHVGNPVPANCEFPVTSRDRTLLVKPNYDQTTETWNLEIIDAATDQLLQTLPGHSGSIQQVIFSEDGNTMVSLGGDLVIKVWRRGEE